MCLYVHICPYMHTFFGEFIKSVLFSWQAPCLFQASKKMQSTSSPSTSLQTRWSPSPSRSRSGTTSSVSETACCSQPWKSCKSSSSIRLGSLLRLSCVQPRFVARTAWWILTALSSHSWSSSPSLSNSEFQSWIPSYLKHLEHQLDVPVEELRRMHYLSFDSRWRYKRETRVSEKNEDEIQMHAQYKMWLW